MDSKTILRRRHSPQLKAEVLASRPLLLATVGRAASSGNQTTLCLTPMHVEAAAEQLPKIDRWRALRACI